MKDKFKETCLWLSSNLCALGNFFNRVDKLLEFWEIWASACLVLTISLQVMELKNYFLPFCPSPRAEADPELYLSSSCFSTVQAIPLLFLGVGWAVTSWKSSIQGPPNSGKASLFPDVCPRVLADYGRFLTGVSGSQVRNLTARPGISPSCWRLKRRGQSSPPVRWEDLGEEPWDTWCCSAILGWGSTSGRPGVLS